MKSKGIMHILPSSLHFPCISSLFYLSTSSCVCPSSILPHPVHTLPLFYLIPCMPSPCSTSPCAYPPPILPHLVHTLPLFYLIPSIPSPFCLAPCITLPCSTLSHAYPAPILIPCKPSLYSTSAHAYTYPPSILPHLMHTLPVFSLTPCIPSPYSPSPRAYPPTIVPHPEHTLFLFYLILCIPSTYCTSSRAYTLLLFYLIPCIPSPTSSRAYPPPVLPHPVHTLPLFYLIPCIPFPCSTLFRSHPPPALLYISPHAYPPPPSTLSHAHSTPVPFYMYSGHCSTESMHTSCFSSVFVHAFSSLLTVFLHIFLSFPEFIDLSLLVCHIPGTSTGGIIWEVEGRGSGSKG